MLLVANNHARGKSVETVRRALFENGFGPPVTHDGIGDMDGKPVAILMIPKYNVVGGLEALALPAIYEKWPLAEQYVEDFLKSTGATAWKQRSIDKARARAAIVGFYEKDPYKGIGHLFRAGILSVDHPCFDQIREFLKNFDAMCGL